MSRIIYGYSGEGSGHSSRTREMASALEAAGHEVRLASYDRGYRNLRDDFDVLEIEGLTISSEDNRVSLLSTIGENLKRLPHGARALGSLRDLFRQFQPHVVVCDFEPMTAYLAEHYQVPLISLDNQHRMRYMSGSGPPGRQTAAALTRRLIQAMVPWPGVSLITALFEAPVTNPRAFVFPPIVRREVRQAEPITGDHVLVYLTSGFDSLLPEFARFGREEFRVYGYQREGQQGPLRFLPPSQQGFIDDLASCRGVIATAGFTLLSEALYLGKPCLVLPMQGQFEQELNAWQLETCGLGLASSDPDEQTLGHFLYRIPEIRDRLANYPRDDGSAIKDRLNELVADEAALARQYQQQRTGHH